MNQKEYFKAVAAEVNSGYKAEGKTVSVSESTVGDVIKGAVKVTTKALAKGDSIQLAGFGTFKVTERAATTGRNPATGETIKIPAKRVAKFKAASALKEALK